MQGQRKPVPLGGCRHIRGVGWGRVRSTLASMAMVTVTGVLCPYCAKPLGSNPVHLEHPLADAIGGGLKVNAHLSCGNDLNRQVDEPLVKSLPVRKVRADFAIPNRRGELPSRPRPVGVDSSGRRSKLEFLPLARLGITSLPEEARTFPVEGMGAGAYRVGMRLDPAWWPRIVAKVALGVGSLAAKPQWLTSQTAGYLREVLWAVDGRSSHLTLPDAPTDPPKGLPLDAVAEPEHFIWTVHHRAGGASVGMWLFGAWFLTAPLAFDADEVALVSERAWLMNPYRRSFVVQGPLAEVARTLRRRYPQVVALRDIRQDELKSAEQELAAKSAQRRAVRT